MSYADRYNHTVHLEIKLDYLLNDSSATMCEECLQTRVTAADQYINVDAVLLFDHIIQVPSSHGEKTPRSNRAIPSQNPDHFLML